MSTLRTNAILDASGGNTATFNGLPLRPGVLDPENRIINGAFDFWQRGTSSTSSGFLADRWNNGLSGGTVTTSRQAFSAGDTLGSNNPIYFFRQTVSGQSATSHFAQTNHPIEGVRSYAGQTITILGWARRSSGSGNMAVDLVQYFGSGGSPSSNVLVSGQTVTLTGSWSPFALTFAVPSISGKTLGTNNNDYLNVVFWTSAGSDYNARTNSLGLQTIGVDLWGIHIKQGTHTVAAADLYRQPELGPELARCQRYYEKSYAINTNPGTAATSAFFTSAQASSQYLANSAPFMTRKRATPSVTVYSPDLGVSGNVSVDGVNRAATVAATETFIRVAVNNITTTVNQFMSAHWAADAEL